MSNFHYQNNQLFAEAVALSQIAEQFGTPCYVYSRQALEQAYLAYENAFSGRETLICYAVKANSNLAVLNVLARLGAGFDIVSGGELERVLAAGGSADKIIFSGVGKTQGELRHALKVGIHCFNVESEAELERLNTIALDTDLIAPVSLRINPDVDAQTHPYISTGLKENKFGINIDQALDVYRHAHSLSGLKVIGVDCHIGSQLTSLSPFADALQRILQLVEKLGDIGITLQHLDLGGGLGVSYQNETPPTPADYAAEIAPLLSDSNLSLILEPGRSISANAGVLLTQVEYLKSNGDKNFAIVDAAMNDLIRPALYQAWMDIIPVNRSSQGSSAVFDIVGPICESSDFLGKDRELTLAAGDLLAVCSVGAYGFGMSSNYNTRNRAAEIMVDGESVHLVRRRETYQDQLSLENLLP
ncbi:MAG: diaminopimelate decarboxylase [SAR86 cluster bacterium]|uniref:Diaminopimelate decarboxylase n=1 Tax=SAR86 cluster bacterium TaxID=2030880 RepID=A0A2A5CII7_9GAMM|nr:MAG: diaminopimelate decarboxylase [SAR86 cluster bacterium]